MRRAILSLIVLAQSCVGAQALAEEPNGGRIFVDSTPQGVEFTIYDRQGERYTGNTPDMLRMMPPSEYTIIYERNDECISPKPQKRALNEDGVIEFLGVYDCDIPKMQMPDPVPQENEVRHIRQVRLWHTLHQTEALAGGKVRVTVGVKNITKSTLEDVTVSEQFDPTKILLDIPLPKGGTVRNGLATWNIPQIYAGQSWNVTFIAGINENITAGETVSLTARIGGGNDYLQATPGTSDLSNTVSMGIATIPQAGEGFDVLFILMTLIGAYVFYAIQRRKTECEG
jgi:hypothetical protein